MNGLSYKLDVKIGILGTIILWLSLLVLFGDNIIRQTRYTETDTDILSLEITDRKSDVDILSLEITDRYRYTETGAEVTVKLGFKLMTSG